MEKKREKEWRTRAKTKKGEWRKGGYGERKKRREQKRSRWYSVNFAAYPLGYRPNDEP